jgi:hypothetical protein
MLVKQISVFLENSKGRLFSVTKILADNNINIRALSIADTTDFGILRLIVNDPNEAYRVLKENSFTVRITEVVAVEIPDVPGGLCGVLEELAKNNIDVEYMYAFLGNLSQRAMVILKIDDTEKASLILNNTKINLIHSDEVYKL